MFFQTSRVTQRGMLGGLLLLAAMFPALVGVSHADEAAAKKTIIDYMKEQAKYTGTLDLYDENIDAVRNLRGAGKGWVITPADEGYAGTMTFRDVNSGDIVTLEVAVNADATAVTGTAVTSVEPPKGAAKKDNAAPAEFSDAEVQAFMRQYLEDQAKFTGYVSLFDPDKETMLKLQLLDLDAEVRRLGKFAISRATFKDTESGKEYGIDLTTEPKGGKLSMQSLRIRER